MANAIVKVLTKLIKKFIVLLLTPVNVIISTSIPNYEDYISVIVNFLNLCGTYFGYIVDMLCIPTSALSFFFLAQIYRVVLSVTIYSVKLAVKWYRALMP